ncbi:MAG: DUF177 domain-containing protein [Firmicutes bacterium]|nr:DUF177 domain-containing protein [Bacillota bacterium]
MQVSIASIREQRGATVSFDFSMPPSECDGLAPDLVAVSPVWVRGTITNAGESMFVRAQASGTFEMACSRCLKPVAAALNASFEERYRRMTPGSQTGPKETSSADDDARPYHGDRIDLSGAVRDHLLLQIPMKPVCRPDCRGLCPHCGADLNEAECGCRPAEGDPRLEVLKELSRRLDPMN